MLTCYYLTVLLQMFKLFNDEYNIRIMYGEFDIDIDIFVNCNWVDTRWQYTFTHK
jgi:hypothetical protein